MKKIKHLTVLHGAICGCSSWRDIQARLRDQPAKQKGDIFEALVQAYLQLEPEYASKLKHVPTLSTDLLRQLDLWWA